MSDRMFRISGVTVDLDTKQVTARHDHIVTLPAPPEPVYHDDVNTDPLEVAHWRFDTLRAGGMSERDAFKATLRPLLSVVAELIDFADGVAVGHDVPAFFRNEAVHVGRLRAFVARADVVPVPHEEAMTPPPLTAEELRELERKVEAMTDPRSWTVQGPWPRVTIYASVPVDGVVDDIVTRLRTLLTDTPRNGE